VWREQAGGCGKLAQAATDVGADISDDLLDALKFSELLPGELARQVILARTLDRDACAFVLGQSTKRHSANVRKDVSKPPSIFNR